MKRKQYRLTAVCKNYIWGGEWLRTRFHKSAAFERIGESWELSCLPEGITLTEDGKRLIDLINESGGVCAGTNCARFNAFPVLCKLIDAREPLSVQVHPNDEYACVHENSYGKDELWYIIDCAPGSHIVYGLNQSLNKKQFLDCINNKTLLKYLNMVEVKKGDSFFIPAGTVHAIGGGVVLAEVQESSAITYRIYDYERLTNEGKRRELHINKALDTVLLNPALPAASEDFTPRPGGSARRLGGCPHFESWLYKIDTQDPAPSFKADGASFLHALILDGNGTLNGDACRAGDGFFIPAGYGECCAQGRYDCLVTSVPAR